MRGPFGAEEFLPDEKRQDLLAEQLGEPRVVDVRDFMESPCFIYSALGHQEAEVGVGSAGRGH